MTASAYQGLDSLSSVLLLNLKTNLKEFLVLALAAYVLFPTRQYTCSARLLVVQLLEFLVRMRSNETIELE